MSVVIEGPILKEPQASTFYPTRVTLAMVQLQGRSNYLKQALGFELVKNILRH